MPPVFAAIGAALVGAFGASVSVATAVFIGEVVVFSAASIGLSFISRALMPSFKMPTASDFANDAQSRTVSVRQPTAPWRVLYGDVPGIGGVITFIAVSGANNKYLNIVYTMSGHQLQGFPAMRFDGVIVPLDGSGNATGKYAGHVHAEFNLGSPGQAAFPGLMAELPGVWTPNHRQRGRSGVWVRLQWNADLFPNGAPRITFDVQGHNQIFDPRTLLTGFTKNNALCAREFIINPSYGLAAAAAEVDDTVCIASANNCDEAVALLAGGTEARYTCDGVFEVSQKVTETLEHFRRSMAGDIVSISGKWCIYSGMWRPPTAPIFTDGDLRSLKVQTRLSRRDTCNGVKGVWLNPATRQPEDYPAYLDLNYVAEDGGEVIWKEMDLPFTNSKARCRRIGKIEVEQTRRQVSAQIQGKLSLYQVQPPEVLQFSHARYSWVAKSFKVAQAKLGIFKDDEGPYVAVEHLWREHDAAIFNWSTADEKTAPTPAVLTLPDTGAVAVLIGLVLSSGGVNAVLGKEGKVITSIFAVWNAPFDQFVLSGGAFEVQYKKSADSIWLSVPDVAGNLTKAEITNVENGTQYDVQVRARNAAGTVGPWVSGTHTANHGIGAPSAPTIVQNAQPIQAGVDLKFSVAGLSAPYLERYLVWRNTVNDPNTAVLADFVPNGLSTAAFDYTWQDHRAVSNVTYWYWLSVLNVLRQESSKAAAGSAVPNFSVPVEGVNLFGQPGTQGTGDLPAITVPITSEVWFGFSSGGVAFPDYRNGREIHLVRQPNFLGNFARAIQAKPITRFKVGEPVTFSVWMRRGGVLANPVGNVFISMVAYDADSNVIASHPIFDTYVASVDVSQLSVTDPILLRFTFPFVPLGGEFWRGFRISNESTTTTGDEIYTSQPMLNRGSDAAAFTTNTFLSDLPAFAFEGDKFLNDQFGGTGTFIDSATSWPTGADGTTDTGIGTKWGTIAEIGGLGISKAAFGKALLNYTAGSGSQATQGFQRANALNTAYAVEAVCDAGAGTGGSNISQSGLIARRTDASNFYLALIKTNPANTVELFKKVAAAYTSLGTFTHSGPSATLRLQVTDATKKVFVNGTERISSADNALTSAGAPGIWLHADYATTCTVKPSVDNIFAYYVQNVAAPATPIVIPHPPPPIRFDFTVEPNKVAAFL